MLLKPLASSSFDIKVLNAVLFFDLEFMDLKILWLKWAVDALENSDGKSMLSQEFLQ